MNNLKNRVYLSHLYDFYGKLLTEKQQLLFALYYNDDYSLGEIAIQENMTRQGVFDHLRRAEERLRAIESDLGLKKTFEKIESNLLELKDLILKDELGAQREIIKEKLDMILEEVANGL